MKYITQILAFYDQQLINPLSTGEIALWHALMHINNKTSWGEWFTVANLTLQSLSGLSRSGINKGRNVLKQRGLIDFKTKGTKATAYHVTNLAMQDSNQDSVQSSNQSSNQDSVQNSAQNSSALNRLDKTRDKTKKNNKKSLSSSQLEQNFAKLWELYPKKQGKTVAFKAYQKAVKDGVTNKQIQQGIVDYQKQIKVKRTEAKFIKMGSTWFNQRGWEDEYDFNADNDNVRETLPDWADQPDHQRSKKKSDPNKRALIQEKLAKLRQKDEVKQ